jgi:hypothetical protein
MVGWMCVDGWQDVILFTHIWMVGCLDRCMTRWIDGYMNG